MRYRDRATGVVVTSSQDLPGLLYEPIIEKTSKPAEKKTAPKTTKKQSK